MDTATTSPAKTITIYVADKYLRGCPGNAAGRPVGYGLTPEQAIMNCEPYANQVPWAPRTARAVVLTDGSNDVDDIAFGLLGEPTGLESPDFIAAYRAAERRQWTIFVARAIEAGLLH